MCIRDRVDALKKLCRHQPLILVDQEGGRVQRLGPPHWRALPSATELGSRHAEDDGQLAKAWAQEAASQLAGIGANCCTAPVLDLYHPGANQVIGDRAYSADASTVAAIGRLVVDQLIRRGITPVVKHIPGHGRAKVDSHRALGKIPTDLAQLMESDLLPFKALKDAPAAMTAHLVYSALDADLPFTQSPRAIAWLREEFGFGGLLLSDCVHMRALSGNLQHRIDAALAAGVDLVIDSLPIDQAGNYQDHEISAQALARLKHALAITRAQPPTYDPQLAGLLDTLTPRPGADPTA